MEVGLLKTVLIVRWSNSYLLRLLDTCNIKTVVLVPLRMWSLSRGGLNSELVAK